MKKLNLEVKLALKMNIHINLFINLSALILQRIKSKFKSQDIKNNGESQDIDINKDDQSNNGLVIVKTSKWYWRIFKYWSESSLFIFHKDSKIRKLWWALIISPEMKQDYLNKDNDEIPDYAQLEKLNSSQYISEVVILSA